MFVKNVKFKCDHLVMRLLDDLTVAGSRRRRVPAAAPSEKDTDVSDVGKDTY